MTAIMRQIRKQILTLAGVLCLAGAGGDVAIAAPGIVVDPFTGVAASGYDPVSYFIEPQPQRGRPEFEAQWQEVTWYFASAANRDIFLRTPEIYAPQFGGHATMSLARGYLAEGDPRIFTRHRLKLYFFYSVGNREAFLLAPDAAIGAAETHWQRFSAPGASP